MDTEQAITSDAPALEELVQYIKSCSKFIIAGHKEPDGDCVGSQLSLHSALTRLGKEAVVCSAGPFKRSEIHDYAAQFITFPEFPAYTKADDCKVIIVDCSNIDRTGDIKDYLKQFPCAFIDHHEAARFPPSSPEEPVYVDANSPSCTLIISKLIKALSLKLTEDEAALLLFGLGTDTGFFRYLTNKNADVFDTTAEFVRHGANPKNIFYKINSGKKINSRILLGRMLSRIEPHFDGKLLYSYETLDDFNAFGLESRDSDTLNQLMLLTKGVKVIVIIRQECADYCTVSFRSVEKINVAEIAASFGGGGHKNAAGLTMKGDIPFVKKEVLESFKNIFN